MINSPLKYHGGKHYCRKWIMENAPPRDSYTHFVDVYGGGASVLLAHDPEIKSEVLNDLDGELMNFWSVLADPEKFILFIRITQAIPFSQILFNHFASLGCLVGMSNGDVERAAIFFVKCRQSLAGRQKDFATLSKRRTRRGMNEQVAAWLTAVNGLPEVHARLIRVVLLNKPALDVLKSEDSEQTWFYCDPPYYPTSRISDKVYKHEMRSEDHLELLDCLRGLRGKVTLSGYHCPVYDQNLRGWRCVERDLPNNAAGGKSKRRMTEVLWMNY